MFIASLFSGMERAKSSVDFYEYNGYQMLEAHARATLSLALERGTSKMFTRPSIRLSAVPGAEELK